MANKQVTPEEWDAATGAKRTALEYSIELNNDNRSRGVDETISDAEKILAWLESDLSEDAPDEKVEEEQEAEPEGE